MYTSFSQRPSSINLSIASGMCEARVSALEVYESVYGEQPQEDTESLMRRIYEPNATYENPLVTATSREMITDIYRVAKSMSSIDMPRPLSLLARPLPGEDDTQKTWFRVLRIWSEITDICETESFDGHRKSMVEHTFHFLFLPGLHAGRTGRALPSSDSSSDIASSYGHLLYSIPHLQRTSDPSLALPGTKLSWPSPLHFEFHVLSRLEFNGERVLHHRDIWDVKDLVALVPGAKLVQYIGGRLTARALASVSSLGGYFRGRQTGGSSAPSTNAQAVVAYASGNCLGLLDIDKAEPNNNVLT